ncbi:MAG: glycoside hydrolase [Gammaproteobacteria bacterium]|nr:glycoside hydrolase [Gammaproteobacteria bacterium]
MSGKLRVVLLWHMHQPDYRDPLTRAFHRPWSFLHAIKDYTDMAAHLERHPRVAAVVNFSPVLLEQLSDLTARLEAHRLRGAPIGEPLLDALAAPRLTPDVAQRRALLSTCLHASEAHQINPHPLFRELIEIARATLRDGAPQPGDAEILDLLVWYHLVWLGETVQREEPQVRRLLERGRHFEYAERRELVELIAGLLGGLRARYATLAGRGQVELSLSPWGHPILPLLLDLAAGRAAQPDSPLPAARHYPDGEARARWHLDAGLATFREYFGLTPAGCWPSEGAVCERSVALIGSHGLGWAATGQRVLQHSLSPPPDASDRFHRPYQLAAGGPWLFFRDDALSDRIGFVYQSWHGDDAAADLVDRLQRIAAEPAAPGRVVTIALDGENPWDHYPANGYYFLSALYRALGAHPAIRMTTPARCLRDPELRPAPLPRLVAGSWVHGDLATWIGDPDKNRAWDLLVQAKRAFDRHAGRQPAPALLRQLAVCEGSDWFWWPGAYNPAETVAAFEHLYRTQLAGLYRMLGVDAPEELGRVFTHGLGHPAAGGTMRPGG